MARKAPAAPVVPVAADRPCDVCATVREHYGSDPWGHPMFNPACLPCGARAIQRLQRKSGLPEGERRTRSQAFLTRWVSMGHIEAEVRALAKKTEWAVAPAPKKGEGK